MLVDLSNVSTQPYCDGVSSQAHDLICALVAYRDGIIDTIIEKALKFASGEDLKYREEHIEELELLRDQCQNVSEMLDIFASSLCIDLTQLEYADSPEVKTAKKRLQDSADKEVISKYNRLTKSNRP